MATKSSKKKKRIQTKKFKKPERKIIRLRYLPNFQWSHVREFFNLMPNAGEKPFPGVIVTNLVRNWPILEKKQHGYFLLYIFYFYYFYDSHTQGYPFQIKPSFVVEFRLDCETHTQRPIGQKIYTDRLVLLHAVNIVDFCTGVAHNSHCQHIHWEWQVWVFEKIFHVFVDEHQPVCSMEFCNKSELI